MVRYMNKQKQIKTVRLVPAHHIFRSFKIRLTSPMYRMNKS